MYHAGCLATGRRRQLDPDARVDEEVAGSPTSASAATRTLLDTGSRRAIAVAVCEVAETVVLQPRKRTPVRADRDAMRVYQGALCCTFASIYRAVAVVV